MVTHLPGDPSGPPHVPPNPQRTGDRRVSLGARLAHGLAALVVGTGFSLAPMGLTAPVGAVGPIPSCDLGEVFTVPRGYDDWSVTLVDRLLRVEDDYIPPDLVPVTDAGIVGGGMIRQVAIEDLRAMTEAAAANGTPIGIWSPYRSFEEQTQIFNGYANQFGFEDAIQYSQVPGHSEHQLGLGVDFMSLGGGNPLPGDWGATPAGAWMRENSWQYGWVNSYPLGEGGTLWNDNSCFRYEPWHYRYLGREVAAAVHESGLTIREYLWANYTMVDPVTGEALPTPTPTPSPTPSPTPTPTASPTPSPTADPTTAPSPAPSAESPSLAGEWFGLQPSVVAGIAGLVLLLVLVPVVLIARRGASRR